MPLAQFVHDIILCLLSDKYEMFTLICCDFSSVLLSRTPLQRYSLSLSIPKFQMMLTQLNPWACSVSILTRYLKRCHKWKSIAIANARYLDLDWNMWRCFKISFEGSVSFTLLPGFWLTTVLQFLTLYCKTSFILQYCKLSLCPSFLTLLQILKFHI